MSQQGTQPTDRASSAAVVAAAMSVLYSWYVFFLQGKQRRGIFIGLWPPTILAFASYLEQTDMVENMQEEME
ncbi:hypothetical protein [Halocatena salina]|uniref:Uncharacterized protein n=1 Tax=Halocatena salina TaxID=2934340 RepID=A0A8U0A6V7_9EURY|nr:hypothetical protein [Halocatena salina]UPM44586.1 hypothetical protein MW046_14440 [Halocatena salina]